jgi:O-glycosyl hydrolase
MITNKKVIQLILAFMLSGLCVKGQDKVVTINIDLFKTHQTINNFGASDAWSCQFIGNWPEEKKNKIADLLFSMDTLKDGSPKGIALSTWRFNIGAGSVEQGSQSGIKDEWRRAESFFNTNGTYNWKKQSGQTWFLRAAKKRGVKQFLGFFNSPPVEFTINGKAFATKGNTNISPEKYDAFAKYISNVVKGVEQVSGVKLNYISPINEPQWDWSDGGQEGCPYKNSEIAGLVRSINKVFIDDHISSDILIAEAGNIKYLFSPVDKPDKGNQINDFFKPGSPNFIGDLKKVSKNIAAHSYFTTSPMASSVKTRETLSEAVNTVPGLNFWQSEYCILGDNAGEMNGDKRDLGINAALYMAKVIHTDLTSANATAWQWWTAVSAYDYKDGLVYVDKNNTDGNFYPSKMLWAMGNYSRFIRPGSIRIDLAVSGDQSLKKPLLVSAFKKGENISSIIINENTDAVPIKVKIGNSKIKSIRKFTTSQFADLQSEIVIDGEREILIPGRSVTTLLCTAP